MSTLNLANAKTLLKESLGLLRSGVWFLDGSDAVSSEPLKVIFAGSEKQKAHLSEVIFCDECTEYYLGKLYFWRIFYLLRTNKSRCDIAIIEGNRLHRSLYKNIQRLLPAYMVKNKSCHSAAGHQSLLQGGYKAYTESRIEL